jgi:hypothetical protein
MEPRNKTTKTAEEMTVLQEKEDELTAARKHNIPEKLWKL